MNAFFLGMAVMFIAWSASDYHKSRKNTDLFFLGMGFLCAGLIGLEMLS